MHDVGLAHLSIYATSVPGRCAVDSERSSSFFLGGGGLAYPTLNPIDFFVWVHVIYLVYARHQYSEMTFCPGSRQHATDTWWFRATATVNGASLRIVQWRRWSSLWTAAVVAAVLMLKCQIVIMLCQCYLCAIKMSSINYIRGLQSHFETSLLPLKKAFSTVPCYLGQDVADCACPAPVSERISYSYIHRRVARSWGDADNSNKCFAA
jgi:hypothetical protein